jgi:hypothetical protein
MRTGTIRAKIRTTPPPSFFLNWLIDLRGIGASRHRHGSKFSKFVWMDARGSEISVYSK